MNDAEFSAYVRDRFKLVATALGASLAIGLGSHLLIYLDERSEATELERSKASVPSDATVTASMLGAAQKQCWVIGVTALERCASLRGQLVHEVSAQDIAEMAIKNRQSYYANCGRHYSNDYCQRLLSRAYEINRRAAVLERLDNQADE